jgi:uncharacterized Zn finger protein
MTRKNVETKARHYLCEGHVIVTGVDGDHVTAVCRGRDQIYRVGHNPGEGWWCDCPAYGRCSHIAALQLVTIRRFPWPPSPPEAARTKERSA